MVLPSGGRLQRFPCPIPMASLSQAGDNWSIKKRAISSIAQETENASLRNLGVVATDRQKICLQCSMQPSMLHAALNAPIMLHAAFNAALYCLKPTVFLNAACSLQCCYILPEAYSVSKCCMQPSLAAVHYNYIPIYL